MRSDPELRAASVDGGRLGAHWAPELRFVAAFALRFDRPLFVGETADGVRTDFMVHGTADGPGLRAEIPPGSAHLLINELGIGVIHVRAPILSKDGAALDLEATGRYDFGEDGYRRAVVQNLPDRSDLGWCPRFLTGDSRYLWLNRAICVGVGELCLSEMRVDYDLFALTPRVLPTTTSSENGGAPQRRPLYERLGCKDGIDKVVNDFIDALDANGTLNRQNPKVVAARERVNPDVRRRKVADFVCMLTGGPCEYNGLPLRDAHAKLDITEADWAIAGQELMKVLNKHKVAKTEQDELLAIIERTKTDIVCAAPPPRIRT